MYSWFNSKPPRSTEDPSSPPRSLTQRLFASTAAPRPFLTASSTRYRSVCQRPPLRAGKWFSTTRQVVRVHHHELGRFQERRFRFHTDRTTVFHVMNDLFSSHTRRCEPCALGNSSCGTVHGCDLVGAMDSPDYWPVVSAKDSSRQTHDSGERVNESSSFTARRHHRVEGGDGQLNMTAFTRPLPVIPRSASDWIACVPQLVAFTDLAEMAPVPSRGLLFSLRRSAHRDLLRAVRCSVK
ncbi:hypothetical protein LXA43DRAFT_430687 [Ganoderma leucocontextum]|nr:hypothetical protein LXA43DRAFT_430687 [Ganoderma leucocontextum]